MRENEIWGQKTTRPYQHSGQDEKEEPKDTTQGRLFDFYASPSPVYSGPVGAVKGIVNHQGAIIVEQLSVCLRFVAVCAFEVDVVRGKMYRSGLPVAVFREPAQCSAIVYVVKPDAYAEGILRVVLIVSCVGAEDGEMLHPGCVVFQSIGFEIYSFINGHFAAVSWKALRIKFVIASRQGYIDPAGYVGKIQKKTLSVKVRGSNPTFHS